MLYRIVKDGPVFMCQGCKLTRISQSSECMLYQDHSRLETCQRELSFSSQSLPPVINTDFLLRLDVSKGDDISTGVSL